MSKGIKETFPRPRPLEGLRVLDVATILAGPVTATFLADFGAEVIKVELPGKGDPTREGPGPGPSLSFLWLQEGRNKKCITLDLHKPKGQDLFKRLAAVSDAMIENFRPGTLESWGLAPEILLNINPRLVILRVSGYGQTGPYRHKGAFDRTVSAFSGHLYATGYPNSRPIRSGYAVADYMSGYAGAFAIMMALYWRDVRGGQGQVIDLALYEPLLRACEASIPIYHRTGQIRERTGDTNPYIVPSSSFPTRDGKWVALSANTERLWQRLATAMGRSDLLSDERFATYQARCANADALYAILEDWTRSKTAAEIVSICDEAEVPASLVNSIADIFADPHVRARENIVIVNDVRVGEVAVPGIIPKMSLTPGRIDYLGQDLGSANDEVYGSLLGLNKAEIAALKEEGVI
ncbi:MAG: CoA transferase [Thermoproteota archaeon]